MTSVPLADASASADRAAVPGRTATPYLRLDLARAVRRFRTIAAAFGPGTVHYAVKANPHPMLVEALVRAGCRFDVASAGEVELCLAAGAKPAHLIYTNPVKRRADIGYAYERGVRRFVADAAGEIDKLAETAPGSAVLLRLATSGAGADWSLSGKFGCTDADLVPLLLRAQARGLDAAGVAFHVGSQQRDPSKWDAPIAQAALAFGRLREAGLRPRMLDVGGGLPARHEGRCPGFAEYRRAILGSIERHFGPARPKLILEPGRGIVGDAGQLVTEVLGVNWRAGRRWVTLDAGIFTGLFEALGEEIRYRLWTDRSGAELTPAVLVGPTCDSLDVIYEKTPVLLPADLREGDRVVFGSAGAYTSAYSTVGFNGFQPLPTVLR